MKGGETARGVSLKAESTPPPLTLLPLLCFLGYQLTNPVDMAGQGWGFLYFFSFSPPLPPPLLFSSRPPPGPFLAHKGDDILLSKVAVGRGPFSLSGFCFSHWQKHTKAIIPNQLEQPAPGQSASGGHLLLGHLQMKMPRHRGAA